MLLYAGILLWSVVGFGRSNAQELVSRDVAQAVAEQHGTDGLALVQSVVGAITDHDADAKVKYEYIKGNSSGEESLLVLTHSVSTMTSLLGGLSLANESWKLVLLDIVVGSPKAYSFPGRFVHFLEFRPGFHQEYIIGFGMDAYCAALLSSMRKGQIIHGNRKATPFGE